MVLSKSGIICAVVAAYIAFLVSLDIPIQIYLANPIEFSFPIFDILVNLVPFFLLIFLLLLLPFLIPSTRIQRAYFGLLVAIALIAWVQSYFLFGDYGLLNGEPLTINDRSFNAYIELLLCIFIVFLFFYSAKLTSMIASLISGIFLLTLLYDIYLISASPDPTPSQKLMSSLRLEGLDQDNFEDLARFSSSKNIIHILLDEFQTDVFQQVLRDNPSLAGKLDGFTFFPNTSSVYPYTEMSLPAIFSGEVYDNRGSRYSYLDESINDSQFFQALVAASYSIQMHLHPVFCNEKYLTRCSSIPGISVRPASLHLVDLAFLRTVPVFYKLAIYNNGDGTIKRLFARDRLLSSQPGIGYFLFDKFNENFNVDDIPPVYKFYQTLITHAPMVLHSDCSLSDKNNPLEMEYMKMQALCALGQVDRLLQNLKASSIYDKTVVIISSDHGGSYFDRGKQPALDKLSIPQKHFARGKSTLLIKPLDAHGSLAVSEYPARVADIPMTISALSGLGFKGSGANIYELDYDISRERDYHFIQLNWGMKIIDKFEGFTTYRISGDVQDASSWRIVHDSSKRQ